MTEKIKEKITLPVSISVSVGIVTLVTGILALIFHYIPVSEIKELSAMPMNTELEFRISVIESKQKKTNERVEYLIEKIESIENQGKILLKIHDPPERGKIM